MAQYHIIDAFIQPVKKGPNAGKPCVVCDIKSLNFWDRKVVRRVFFDAYIVEALSPYITVDKGGTAQQKTDIPAQFQLTGCMVPWSPTGANGMPRPFYKRHLSDHPEIGIKAGDLVCNNATKVPNIYTTLQVFCQYEVDEFGKKQWLGGEDPDTVGQAAFDAYCVPVDAINTPQAVTTDAEYLEVANPQPAAPQQPVQQPAQPQFIQQPVQQPGAPF